MEGDSRLQAFRQSLSARLATANLRRLHAAWAASALGSWTFVVALAFYANGGRGATAVGLAAFARMIPAGRAAPAAGLIAVVPPGLAIAVLLGLGIGYARIQAGGLSLLQRARPPTRSSVACSPSSRRRTGWPRPSARCRRRSSLGSAEPVERCRRSRHVCRSWSGFAGGRCLASRTTRSCPSASSALSGACRSLPPRPIATVQNLACHVTERAVHARTVRARRRDLAVLFALEREVFLNAVSTRPRSSAVAEQTATTRPARDVAARTGTPV